MGEKSTVYDSAIKALEWGIEELKRAFGETQASNKADPLVLTAYRLARAGNIMSMNSPLVCSTFKPIAVAVSIDQEETPSRATNWYYAPRSHFPKPRVVPSGAWQSYWQELKSFLPSLPQGQQLNYVSLAAYLDRLAVLLGWFPALAYDGETSSFVSQYSVMHLAAALAVCLSGFDKKRLERLAQQSDLSRCKEAIARLVKVDISGIQAFIYRIVEPRHEMERKRASKRLRGRSFHLTLLNRVLGDWLLYRLGLPPTNLFQDSGGVIEMLLPNEKEVFDRLHSAFEEMEKALWDTFQGSLG
ncbi:MAG: hypothetical protein J7M05_14260, partial [Anaerolineae bacterium]|nr:hypothetical protein [Anaerolineae bacterium]